MLVTAVLLAAVVVSIVASVLVGVVVGRPADNALARLEPTRHATQ